MILAGAEAEDYPNLPFKKNPFTRDDPIYFLFGSRARHHFHDPEDPLTPGQDNLEAIVDPAVRWYTKNLAYLHGISAGNRAIGSDPSVFGSEGVNTASPKNYFDWEDARRYYFRALTSTTEEERSHFFALTFLAMGHIMHLVEDMAVPAHTRNDMAKDHIYSYAIFWRFPNFEKFVEHEKTNYIRALQTEDIGFAGHDSLPGFWDGGGTAPSGLTEYSNRNFLSMGTMFKNYPQPDLAETSFHFEFGGPTLIKAYLKRTTDNGEPLNHLARLSLSWGIYREIVGHAPTQLVNHVTLDNACHESYANLLIPKAIAYAAGVLEHFFRGKLEVEIGFDGSLAIGNGSEDDMSGLYTLYYDRVSGERFPVPGGQWEMTIPAGEAIRTESGFTIPSDKDPHAPITLVFEGRLGQEEDAVAGRVFQVPNAVKVWEIYYYDNDSHYVWESHGHYTSDGHSVYLTSGRYAFTHNGGNTAHYILAFYYDPAGGDPLPLGPPGVIPLYRMTHFDRSWFTYSYPFIVDGPCAFVEINNRTINGYLMSPIVQDVLPGWMIQHEGCQYFYDWEECPPLNYWFFHDHCGKFMRLPVPAPEPYLTEGELEFITKGDLRAFLTSLHDGLHISSGMDIPGAVYALLTIPIPEPETYDITWSDMEPPDTSDLCGPDYSITGVLVPEFWDLDQVDFYVGDEEEPLMPVEFYQDYVFGQFFLRVEEVYDELNGLRSYRYEYNPDNPFETINSGP